MGRAKMAAQIDGVMVLLVILFEDAPNNVLGRMMLSTRATPGVHAVGSSELTRVVGAAVVQPMMLLMHHKADDHIRGS